ncbi:hypothetical protein HWV01_03235 [Moritella sp. 5]|uniref:glycosyltransferase family 32 protein n=1 Tax=Moritella sp. 5 TaxID=2746231 RepID=UPI001BA4801A|nr:capsular polysaccharide synthesis protein [Moritella sp. 5]QUM79387.1 hypothetical protein HWV01_03235 [Moritella sp. 5]
MSVPKIIHHIWIGSSELPENVKKCIESSNFQNKDYQHILHTDCDYNILPPFIKYCYDKQLWAFVSDYLRFKYLFEDGGIYLDTDMYVLRDFSDFLDADFFSGYNREKSHIYCGIIGCEPGNSIALQAMKFYENYNSFDLITSPEVLSKVFYEYKTLQSKIYSSNFFYPISSEESYDILDLHSSYTTHLWDESWVKFVGLRRVLRRLGIIRCYHKLKKCI